MGVLSIQDASCEVLKLQLSSYSFFQTGNAKHTFLRSMFFPQFILNHVVVMVTVKGIYGAVMTEPSFIILVDYLNTDIIKDRNESIIDFVSVFQNCHADPFHSKNIF
jgi:hypothetical protein